MAGTVRGAALWSIGAQYLAFAASFVTSVLISRFFLQPEEVGLFSIALAAAMTLSVLQDFGISRYIAGAPELDAERLRACFSISLLFSLALAAIIFALAEPAARFYGDGRLQPIFAVIAGSYLLVPFAIVPAALLQRELDFRALFFVNVGAAAVQSAVALGLAAAGFSAMSLAWSVVAHALTRALLATALSGHRPRWPLRFRGARPILGFGAGMTVLIASGSLGTRTPDLIVGRLVSVAGAGLFSRATGLAGHLAQLVGGAIGGVFYPAFRRMRDAGEPLGGPYLRVVGGMSALTWPAMALLAAASTPVVLLLYGPAWAATAPLLAWIALAQIPFTALPLHMDIPILLGRMRALMALNLLDTAASVATLILGAAWGLEYAALSRIAYGLVWFGIYARFMRGMIGFRWRDMASLYAKGAALAGAAVAPVLAVYALWLPPGEVGPLLLAGCAIAGGLLWLAALFLVRHPVRAELIDMARGLRGALPGTPQRA